MTLAAGSRLGIYEILAPLGSGGMGEVYRAKDTRLFRDVALKVLPEDSFQNKEYVARFEREAQLLAAVNNPRIAALYSFEEISGRHVLVMELLDGETLAGRLEKGPLRPEQVLRYGIEIASALDAAHRGGIVHRDLKPGNVMLTKSGVKLLDFGLAKAAAAPFKGSGATSLPTELPKNLTQQGTILGTFQYMAPEQLEGKEADARSDIFSFGAVLYEMATGRKAFEAKSQASLIAAILQAEPPPVSSIQPMAPPALDRVAKTCLAKDPDERWQNAHDLMSELEWIAQGGSQSGVAAPVAASHIRRGRIFWVVLGAVAGAIVAAAALWGLSRRGAALTRPITRVAVPIPTGDSFVTDSFSPLTISPDGRQVVYVGRRADKRQLFIRPLDAADASPVAGTEGAYSPFFSPDGQWIGFWADGKIRKTALSGGAPVGVCECGVSEPMLGAAWGPDDVIVFPQRWGSGFLRVPASGGTPQPVTKVSSDGDNRGHLWPEVLPGGKAVLFTIFTGGNLEDYQIAAASLATGEQKTLVKGGTYARYAASGHILFVRGGTLFAVPFDSKRLEVTGAAFPVADGVFENTNGGAGYAVSRNGTLLYAGGGILLPERSLLWVDRKGTAKPVTRIRRPFANPVLSPDGQRVALTVEAETYDVWVLDIERDSLSRLTFGKDDGRPVWSPDGQRVVYQSGQSIYVRAADGSGSEERLTSDQDTSFPLSFSPDGKLLLFQKTRAGVPEIWIYPFEKGSTPRPFLQGPFRHDGGAFSPDGRWMAYQSNESGKGEVYVTAFPGPGGKWQISTEGGRSPLWAPSGREMFYRKDKKVMRVAVANSPVFSASRPELVFEGDYGEGDFARDGQRFLMIKDEAAESAPKHLNLVLDWFDDAKPPAPSASKR